MEIKLVDSNNFTRDSLKDFRRYQEVKNVYRLQNGDYRRRGIGRVLFEAARQEALKMGAHALYASCCSSEETINFYSAMGFRLSSDPIPSYAEAEPCDLQMECMIAQEMQ